MYCGRVTSGALDGYDKQDVAGLLEDRLAKARERLEEKDRLPAARWVSGSSLHVCLPSTELGVRVPRMFFTTQVVTPSRFRNRPMTSLRAASSYHESP
jgi:hypothetical protein